ncbi:MAG: alpha-2-macroglobulin family protein, partial [Roseibacillus sp.]|nr:alpha-2-macroglobulin family protein [Roseibacillus sp.]
MIVRSEFADLVKWAGAVTTNERGEAEIEVDYPDNLTTWKVKIWALGHGTRVGEGSAEVITSKDLIVRLQAPRFFVESDEVVLSAVVHNYHEEAKEVDVVLELDGGTLQASGPQSSRVVIPAGGEKRVDWRTIAKREGEVTVRMKAIASDDSDAMEMSFPVYVHGMHRTESWSRALRPEEDSVAIDFEVPAERQPDQTRLEIRYSPTVAGAMVDALPYLANYPYGCTEQTLNRFVPAVITQRLL